MTDMPVYEASVYTRTVQYKNLKTGETKTADLYFLLHPLTLMEVMADYEPKKIKSGNPALNGKPAEMTDKEQIQMVQNLAKMAAGWPSEDGEGFDPFPDFETKIMGAAFMTKLVSSEADRREFSEKAILDPFRAFVKYFVQDPSNSDKEINDIQAMLVQIENVFKVPETTTETTEERATRLKAELAALETNESN